MRNDGRNDGGTSGPKGPPIVGVDEDGPQDGSPVSPSVKTSDGLTVDQYFGTLAAVIRSAARNPGHRAKVEAKDGTTWEAVSDPEGNKILADIVLPRKPEWTENWNLVVRPLEEVRKRAGAGIIQIWADQVRFEFGTDVKPGWLFG